MLPFSLRALTRAAAVVLAAGSGSVGAPVINNEGGDIDAEALVATILSVDARQRAEIADVVFDVERLEGERDKNGVFEEKERFVKKVYVRNMPDTTLLYEEYLEFYKDGELQDESEMRDKAKEHRERKKGGSGKSLPLRILRAFEPDNGDDYEITYLGIAPETVEGHICHLFQVRALREDQALINGDFYLESETFHLARVDYSPAKLVNKLMFKLKKLTISVRYAPDGDGHWLPRQAVIDGQGKAALLVGVKFTGMSYYRNPQINTGINDKVFEDTDE